MKHCRIGARAHLSLAIAAAVIALALLVPRPAAAQELGYSLTISLAERSPQASPGFDVVWPKGINSAGQVVGESRRRLLFRSYGDPCGVLWTPGGTDGMATNPQMMDLGTYATANAINDSAQAVGSRHILGTDDVIACLWEPGGAGVIDIGALGPHVVGGRKASYALAINASGQVTGHSSLPHSRNAFLWHSSTGIVNLGALTTLHQGVDFSISEGLGINDAGQVVGVSINKDHFYHAFVWTPGGKDGVDTNPQMKDLGAFPHTYYGQSFEWSEARDINNNGQIVGFALTGSAGYYWGGTFRATMWENGQIVDLGTLGGTPEESSGANAINDAGLVVDHSSAPFFGTRACLWQNGTIRNLNELIPFNPGLVLQDATGINESGQIVGYAYSSSGHFFGFLLTPNTPETAAEGILREVQVLIASGTLSVKDGQPLNTTLQTAVDRIAAGNTGAAINVLNAFENKVNALMKSGRLTAEDGQPMIEQAQAIVTALGQ